MERQNNIKICDQFNNPPELLKSVLDGLQARVMFIDTNFNIIYMNKEKQKKNPTVKTGMKCYEVFEEYGMRCPFCVAYKAIETKKIHRNEDYVAIHKGIEIPVHMSITAIPVIDENDNIIGIIEITYDIENLYQTNVRLERLNQEYEHVIYALSHDLRAPLVSIEGFLAKLVQGKHIKEEDEVADHCIVRIHANVKMMNNLVKVLLDTSRIATGRLEIQEVDLDFIVCDVVEELKSQNRDTKASFVFQLETKNYRCDRIRVEQVFRNLIENSLQHCKDVEDLVIEIGSKQNTFWIKDNGPGIPESFQDRAFDAFSQGGNSMSSHFGMGMNIVFKIIEKHGGKVWIESKEKQGTTVFFTLKPL